jgi:hypothetical protein
LNYPFRNAARLRGRPRSLNEKEVLKKATQAFWSKGYDGVPIDDLVAGMGWDGRARMPSSGASGRFSARLKGYAEKKGALAAKALLSPQTLRLPAS